jgi:protein arginine kinase activator
MKLCDQCGKTEAILTITEVDKEGTPQQVSLCRDCAEKKGIIDKKLSIAQIFTELLKEKIETEDQQLICPACALSYAEFKKGGRLGCAQCYSAFKPKLTNLIRRIQGATRHKSKHAAGGEKPIDGEIKVQQLRQELQQAISQEEYEKAAVIRDQLQKYEKRGT